MNIALSRWIAEGTIAPWVWGASLDSFFIIVPAAKVEIAAQLRAGYPFVTLDNVEFYFEGDEFTHLTEVIIKAWAISDNEKSTYFIYDYIRNGLTFKQVTEILEQAMLPYKIQRGHLGTPHILASNGVFFAFYTDSDTDEEAELAKIHLTCPVK